MADGEKIDIVKAVKSPFTGLYWVKTIMYGFGIFCLLFIGYGVYKAYFKKPPVTQTQNQNIGNITVQTGGHLHLGQESTEKKKWPWYIPHPFVDVYIYKENDRDGWGTRFGGRWQWD